MDLASLELEIINCRKCPRLVEWRERVGVVKRKAFRDEVYWAKPVPGFGDPHARLLVVGLAPGAHGSNRTGRMFTGDGSGDFLYPALFRAGFASQPVARNLSDGMVLFDIFITAICRCVPPDNKPTREEVINCRDYLVNETACFKEVKGIVALGKIAYEATLQALALVSKNEPAPAFGHGVLFQPQAKPWVLASYHPSRQNTQTGRLTPAMFDQIWEKAGKLLAG